MREHAERIAQAFHETYERLALDHGYTTREAGAKPWAEVPEANRALMVAVVGELLDRGVIEISSRSAGPVPTPDELRASSRWRPTDPQIKPIS
jgi:hypothetical protein